LRNASVAAFGADKYGRGSARLLGSGCNTRKRKKRKRILVEIRWLCVWQRDPLDSDSLLRTTLIALNRDEPQVRPKERGEIGRRR
jgi:hypothetical protein